MPKLVRPEDESYEQWATTILRVEMARRRMSYAALADQLVAIGVRDNERNIRNKVARGTFSAAFFLQCLLALGITRIDLISSVTKDTIMGPRGAEIEVPPELKRPKA